MLDITSIPSSRVPFIDARTGMISREWYRFLLNQFQLTGNGSNTASITDLQLGPPSQDNAAIIQALEDIGVQPGPGVVIENQEALLLPQPQLGTMAAENTDNLRMIGFATSPSPAIPATPNIGSAWWNGGTTLNIQMTAGVTQPVGEAVFTYVKASAAVTKGQLLKHTGAVGASGVPTVAPTSTGMTNPDDIVAVAAEDIALNGFGLVQKIGILKGFNTTGTAVGEVWADGDPLYYNPAYAGSFTNVRPTAPDIKVLAGEVINAGSGGSGSIMVRFVYGSTLGGTDSNVEITSVADKNLLQYDSGLGYWKNVANTSVFTGPAFAAYQSTPQTLSSSTTTKISLQTEEYDTNNNFDSTTNYRFTPTVAGYYQINGGMTVSTTPTGGWVAIYKNGSLYKRGNALDASGTTFVVSSLVHFNGSTDYVEMYGNITTGQQLSSGSPAEAYTYFNGSMTRSE